MNQNSLKYVKYSLEKAQEQFDDIMCNLPEAVEGEEGYVDPPLGMLDVMYNEIIEVQDSLSNALWGAGGYREVVRFNAYGKAKD